MNDGGVEVYSPGLEVLACDCIGDLMLSPKLSENP